MKIKKSSDFTPKQVLDPDAVGVSVSPMITAKDGAPGFAMRLFELKAGGNTPRHQHDWEHEVFIAEGSGEVFNKGNFVGIEKGDFIFVEPGEIHQFKAGKEGIKFICVVPNKGQPA